MIELPRVLRTKHSPLLSVGVLHWFGLETAVITTALIQQKKRSDREIGSLRFKPSENALLLKILGSLDTCQSPPPPAAASSAATGQPTLQGHSRVFCALARSSLLLGDRTLPSQSGAELHGQLGSSVGRNANQQQQQRWWIGKKNFHSFSCARSLIEVEAKLSHTEPTDRTEPLAMLLAPIKRRRWRRPHQVTFAASGHPFGVCCLVGWLVGRIRSAFALCSYRGGPDNKRFQLAPCLVCLNCCWLTAAATTAEVTKESIFQEGRFACELLQSDS